MKRTTLRRSLAAVGLTVALSMVPGASAEAAALRWRESSPAPAKVLQARGFLAGLWSRLVTVWQEVGVTIDGNG